MENVVQAVALKDCEGRLCFGSGSLSSGKVFATIDGKRKEGIVNPKQAQGVGDTERIIFKPGIPLRNELCPWLYKWCGTDHATDWQITVESYG